MPLERAKTDHNNTNYSIATNNDDDRKWRGSQNAAGVPIHSTKSEEPSAPNNTTTPDPPAEPPHRV